jgi:hypothetical protein
MLLGCNKKGEINSLEVCFYFGFHHTIYLFHHIQKHTDKIQKINDKS